MKQLNTYENKLKNYGKCPKQFCQEEGYKELLQVVDYYEDYVNDKERLLDEIIYKINKYDYVNAGCVIEDNWRCNKHVVYINNERFDYKTGMGINCNDCKTKGYNREKIIFDCLMSIISDTNILDCYIYDENAFLSDFGYDDNIKNIRKGEEIFQQMKENRKKILKILDLKTIQEINEIIEL